MHIEIQNPPDPLHRTSPHFVPGLRPWMLLVDWLIDWLIDWLLTKLRRKTPIMKLYRLSRKFSFATWGVDFQLSQGQHRHCSHKSLTPAVSVILLSFRLPTYRKLHCALASCGAVYCNRSCLWLGVCVCVCVWGGWVCYHDNSKLRASIFTKLGL